MVKAGSRRHPIGPPYQLQKSRGCTGPGYSFKKPAMVFLGPLPYRVTLLKEGVRMAWYYKDMGIKGTTRHYVAVAVCDRCGVEFRSDNVKVSKYCQECQITIYREKNAERQRRFRERLKKKAEEQQPAGLDTGGK